MKYLFLCLMLVFIGCDSKEVKIADCYINSRDSDTYAQVDGIEKTLDKDYVVYIWVDNEKTSFARRINNYNPSDSETFNFIYKEKVNCNLFRYKVESLPIKANLELLKKTMEDFSEKLKIIDSEISILNKRRL